MKHRILTILLAGVLAAVPAKVFAADKVFQAMADSIKNYLFESTSVSSGFSVEKAIVQKDGTLRLNLGKSIIDYPLREKDLEQIMAIVKDMMPSNYAKYRNKFKLYADGKPVDYYVTNMFKANPDSKPVKDHYKYAGQYHEKMPAPLVTRVSSPVKPEKGLQNRHIALWQSHGFYYEQSLKRWEWQRARILETVEDLYTQSYVLPFLTPMLENAGAIVMLPRERDWNINEVIVDNDIPGSGYSESGVWTTAKGSGFGNPQEYYLYDENPFEMGTVRLAGAPEEGVVSTACWTPDIPESGEYAVYVSYKTFLGSTTAAHYTVKHKGGDTKFLVNQQMGGGTWIYLGRFPFEKGQDLNQGVFLTNEGETGKGCITADAVKFGGGMGNIARKPNEVTDFDVEPEVSGYPRFTEGSRYWLQWAGFDKSVYSANENTTDYNDDYMSRGLWVNALSDGSYLKPDSTGFNIPLDLSFAFHTDAGTFPDDEIVGTLSIYTRLSNKDEKYPNHEDRSIARDYADMVQTQIVNDVRALYEPQWKRRFLWDRSYAESRSPEVPAMLLEFLSHQNLADMRYGLDPSFRFTVSRAIYKGMLKYLAYLNGFEYCVQPLPVNSFAAVLNEDCSKVVLTWEPTKDDLEETAVASSYVVYTRVDGAGFDNGVAVSENNLQIDIEPGHIYSFKVTAVNAGGESFPSEILSVGVVSPSAKTALVVNNFDRVSAPVSFASPDSTYAGFMDGTDAGVPYIFDISYIGPQHEFRREIPWMDDDSAGFGASDSDYETKVVAGNTFDYPYVHGKALMAAGYNFVSAGRSAIEAGSATMSSYPVVDVICGKQITTQVGRRGAAPLKYTVFTPSIQKQISDCAAAGGNILVSGAYVGSDIWEPIFDYEVTEQMKKEVIDPAKKFAQEVLHYRWMTNCASANGTVRGEQNMFGLKAGARYDFDVLPNSRVYAVESADGLNPVGKGAYSIFRYADNNISAGVAYWGKYKTVVLGFPIEVLSEESQIDALISDIVRFFEK